MKIPSIDVKGSETVRAALSAIGRTEDLRFSPDNRLLAIAAFARKRCLILRIDVEMGSGGPGVGGVENCRQGKAIASASRRKRGHPAWN